MKRLPKVLAWALPALLLLVLNYYLSVRPVRLDATSEGRYSLAPETLRQLTELTLPVEADFYCSRGVAGVPPSLQSHADYLKEVLAEYERHSGGKLRVRQLDPKPGSATEERALRSGMRFNELRTGDPSSRYCLGVCFRQLGKADVSLGQLLPAGRSRLEYDLTLALARLTSDRRTRVGILSRLPVFGGMVVETQRQLPEWGFVQALRRCNYDVVDLQGEIRQLPDGLDVLLMVQPPQLDAAGVASVAGFVHGGGRMICFLDPACWTEMMLVNGPKGGDVPAPADLSALFSCWGIEFHSGKTVLDPTSATIVMNRKSVPENHIEWLSLKGGCLSSTADETRFLSLVEVYMSGYFSHRDVAGISSEELLTTTSEAQVTEVRQAFRQQRQLSAEYVSGGQKLCLGMALTGVFPAPAGVLEAQGGLGAAGRPSQVMVFGDVDCLQDNFCQERQTGNLQLLLNCMDRLCADNSFMTLRNRSFVSRTLTLLETLKEEGKRAYQERLEHYQQERDALSVDAKALEAKSGVGTLTDEDSEKLRALHDSILTADRELRALQLSANSELERARQKIVMMNFLFGPVLLLIVLGLYLDWRHCADKRRRAMHVIAILIVVAAIAVLCRLFSAVTEDGGASEGDKSVKLLDVSIDRSALQEIRIEKNGGAVTLKKGADGRWTVQEAGGYPAELRLLNHLVETLDIAKGEQVEIPEDVRGAILSELELDGTRGSAVTLSMGSNECRVIFGAFKRDYENVPQGRYVLLNDQTVVQTNYRYQETELKASQWIAKALPGISEDVKRLSRESELKGLGWSLLKRTGGYEIEGRMPNGYEVNAEVVTNIIENFLQLRVLGISETLERPKLELRLQVIGGDDILYGYEFYSVGNRWFAQLASARSATRPQDAQACMEIYGKYYMELQANVCKAFMRNRPELLQLKRFGGIR